MTWRDYTCVEDQAEDGEEHVDVEESCDFLSADGCELAAHVEDHNDGHDQGGQVHKVDGGLEDDGIGELDAAGVAGREDGGRIGDGVDWADEGAEREGASLAY